MTISIDNCCLVAGLPTVVLAFSPDVPRVHTVAKDLRETELGFGHCLLDTVFFNGTLSLLVLNE